MKTSLKNLLAAPLILLAACGTPASSGADADCGDAESFESNGNTYCVASRAIIEKGFECPTDMFDIQFGEVTVCSPNEMVPDLDKGELYEYAQGQGGTGDPLQACTGEDPSAQECQADGDCAAGQTCVESDTAACQSSICFCDAGTGQWNCTGDCGPVMECADAATSCSSDAECASGEVCVNGACEEDTATCDGADPSEQECDTDADCASGQACVDLDTAVCVPSSCECDGGSNVWVCTEDCGSERACQAEPATACTADSECGSGETCVSGTCTE